MNRSDSAATDATRSSGRGCGCCLTKVVLLVVMLVAITAAATYAFRTNNKSRLTEAIDGLRTDRTAVTLPELNEAYQRLASQENNRLATTDEWRRSLEPLTTPEYEDAGEDISVIGLGHPAPPLAAGKWGGLDSARTFIKRYQSSVTGLQLAASGDAYFPIDLTRQERLPEEIITQIFRGLELLKLNCYVQLYSSDRNALAACLNAMLNYSRCLREQPAHQFERFQLDQDAFEFVGQFVHRVEFTPEQLQQFVDAAQRDYWTSVREAFALKRARMLWIYTDFDAFAASPLSNFMKTRPEWKGFWEENAQINLVYSPFVWNDAKRFLRYCIWIDDKLSGDWMESFFRVNEFEQQLNQTELSGFEALRFPTAHFLVPRISKHIWFAAQAEMDRRLLLTVLAFDRYRLDNPRSATELNAIVPQYLAEIPADIYGDGPIRFRVLPRELRAYSVGPDGADDQGQGDDIVYRLLEQKWNPSGDPTISVD